MLVISRRKGESIVIGDNIVLNVVEIRGDKIRLGIEAPIDVPVHRSEVYPPDDLPSTTLKKLTDHREAWPKIAIWLLADPVYGALRHLPSDEERQVNQELQRLYEADMETGSALSIPSISLFSGLQPLRLNYLHRYFHSARLGDTSSIRSAVREAAGLFDRNRPGKPSLWLFLAAKVELELNLAPDERGFCEDILAHPDDRLPAAIFADWLEERADRRAKWYRQV